MEDSQPIQRVLGYAKPPLHLSHTKPSDRPTTRSFGSIADLKIGQERCRGDDRGDHCQSRRGAWSCVRRPGCWSGRAIEDSHAPGIDPFFIALKQTPATGCRRRRQGGRHQSPVPPRPDEPQDARQTWWYALSTMYEDSGADARPDQGCSRLWVVSAAGMAERAERGVADLRHSQSTQAFLP